ncbi:tight adherence protein B [Lachnospiraceae bacterium C7]|nr:tight adherence protein B [Lachnospiraceae bacterium C7]
MSNYNEYIFTKKDKLINFASAIVLAIVIAYLFYNSPIALVVTPGFYIFIKKFLMKYRINQQKKEVEKEFVDGMQSVCTSLLAGYSLENAFKEAETELKLLYGENAIMVEEFRQINQSVELNIPLEKIIEDFALRSGSEEIVSFSEVFSYAKRGGGDFVKIIETTTMHIRETIETHREIDILVASKKYEQNIMSGIPIFIMAYLRVSSGDYLNALYHNVAGVLFMTVCLGAYGAAFYLADKILQIEV